MSPAPPPGAVRRSGASDSCEDGAVSGAWWEFMSWNPCLSHVVYTSVMWRWSLSLMQQPLAVLWKQLSQLTQIVLSWKLSRHSPVSPWDEGHGACGATVLINRPEISSAAGSSGQTGRKWPLHWFKSGLSLQCVCFYYDHDTTTPLVPPWDISSSEDGSELRLQTEI